MTTHSDEPSAGEVATERRHLFTLAYRMFGSTAEAEEVVRQTYARWYCLPEAERAAIADPRSWLANTAGRLCLARLSAPPVPRVDYPGEWLPEPVPGTLLPAGAARGRASDQLSLDESVTMGLLVTLESLGPSERVAFVLHDVFGMPFSSVGAVVGRTASATRALAKDARGRIRDRLNAGSEPDQHPRTVHNLRRAAETGQPGILAAVLAPDVAMFTDSGGVVPVDPRTLRGAETVARKICDVLQHDPTDLSEQQVNGQSGLVLRRQGTVVGIVSVNVREYLVTDLWIVLNPDKLRHWNQPEPRR